MAKHDGSVTVGCLFTAMGGLARAFAGVGGRVLWANERDHFATTTFVANFPHVRHLLKDVADLSVAGDRLAPVDVLTAGFPCQPFSNAGLKRGFADERGLAFLHIVRLLGEFGRHKPKVLLLENVEYFRNHDDGRTFRRVQAEVQRAGYWFTPASRHYLPFVETMAKRQTGLGLPAPAELRAGEQGRRVLHPNGQHGAGWA